MSRVCVSRNMSIAGGVLGIQPWAVTRIVHDATYTSVGDGAFTALQSLPGKLMIDSGVISWTSDSPLDTQILLRVQRGRRMLHVSNPNAAQIRDRWTYTVDGTTPRVPDVSSTYNGQTGTAIDLGAGVAAMPLIGQYWVYEDPALEDDWIDRVVPAGGTFKVWYRANLWTPPPWSDNANNGSPVHEAFATNTRIQIMAWPQTDPAVTA